MKKTFFLLAALLVSFAMMAQEEPLVKTPSGYQGFLEQGSIYRLADDANTTIGVSTTHGFYFGGHTFVGIGFAVEGGGDFFAVPVYTAVKYNFGYSKTVTPTVQVRLGSYLSDDPGTYADLAVGVRFGSKRDFAVNIMLTGTFYEMMKYQTSYWDFNTSTEIYETKIFNPSGIGLRVGIEW